MERTRPVLTQSLPHGGAHPADPGSHPSPSGLICLKGGDLAAEISASGCRPKILEIYDLFPQDYFREKYLLQVPF
jgi:16S rRNA (guanine527-N7)-methyltransferase